MPRACRGIHRRDARVDRNVIRFLRRFLFLRRPARGKLIRQGPIHAPTSARSGLLRTDFKDHDMRSELTPDEERALRARLESCRLEHRALDAAIERLVHDPLMDQLQLRRLKKRRLALKDVIVLIENILIPDQPA